MLWNASAINGYTIRASDGQLGTVSDFFVDGQLLGSLVASWIPAIGLPGRKVLLPLGLGAPR